MEAVTVQDIDDMDITPYSRLSDDELLARVYMDRQLMSTIALELAARLEQALEALRERPQGIGDVVTRTQLLQLGADAVQATIEAGCLDR